MNFEGDRRLPWSMVAGALVAMTAHYLTADQFLGLPICGIVLVASQLTTWRLPQSRAISWSLRAMVLTVITVFVGFPNERLPQWYMKPEYTKLIGCLLAAELAIRAWERREPSGVTESRGVTLLLTALIMAAASNTAVRTYIHRIAPVYAVLLLLSLRSFARSPRARASTTAFRGMVMVVAVELGMVMVASVTSYEQTLTTWAVNFIGANRRLRNNEIGLSGNPRLGPVSNPEESMDRVLLIAGPRGERYLRALAFDRLEDRQWKPALRERAFGAVDMKALRTDQPGQKLLFTRVGETLDLLPLPSSTALIDAPRGIDRDELSSLRDQETALVGAASRYEVVVPSNERFQGPLWQAMDDAQRSRALSIPAELDSKVIEIARHVAGEGDAMSRVLRLVQHLRSNHQYSLSYKPGVGDPLSDFILNHRAAHCQYFASALVVMSRAIGVPARFVTGYYAHESYGPDQTVVRQRDAHAWAECWIDGTGWITLDATPAGGLPDGQFSDASKLRRMWERVTDVPGLLRDWMAGFSRRLLVTTILASALLVMLMWAARLILSRRRGTNAGSLAYATPCKDLLAAGERFEQLLCRLGRPCDPQRTWREHVACFPDTRCMQFVDAYDRARFGGADGEARFLLQNLLGQLEKARSQETEKHHGSHD